MPTRYRAATLPNGARIDWGDAMPAIGSVAGSVIDAISQAGANRATARSAREQIEFQREQSATSYQRAVADLQAAGLNPGLAYQQGGADSGSGTSYQAQPNVRGAAEKIMAGINAYQAFANGTAQRALIRAQTSKTEAEAAAASPLAALSRTGDFQTEFSRAQIADLRRRIAESQGFPAKYAAELAATVQGTATARAAEANTRSQTTLNEQQFTNEWYRKNVLPYINSTVKTLDLFKPNFKFR